MTYSLNEIHALAKRASRGAGHSWGIAEEAAMATRWLASFGLNGPELLARLLVQNDGIPMIERTPDCQSAQWQNQIGRLCPIITGVALSDRALQLNSGTITLQNVTQPLLLLPFAANVAKQINKPVSLTWDGGVLVVDGVSLAIHAAEDALNRQEATIVKCTGNGEMVNALLPSLRGDLTDSTLSQLSDFGLRSFAPITAESRDAGAGSDTYLSDND